MKKNWILRLGVLAMVLTLVTMPMVSSTYAKYVTSATGTDTARVAKWGVTVAVTPNVFTTSYLTDSTPDDATITSSVESLVDVMAPGTEGTFAGVSITGTPEVAVEVTLDATMELGANWTDGTNYYCPLIITVDGVEYYGLDYLSADDFEDAVEAAIEAVTDEYPAGTDLTTALAYGAFDWKWDFEAIAGTDVSTYFVNTGAGTGAAATGTFVSGTTYYDTLAHAQTNDGTTGLVDSSAFVEASSPLNSDIKDTYLGTAAVVPATAPSISLQIVATVTQIN